DAELIGDCLSCQPASVQPANLDDILFGEFGEMMLLTLRRAAVSDHILGILGMSSPAQIRQAIVRIVAIEMSTLHPIGAWADEGCQDQSMNVDAPALTGGTKTNLQVSRLGGTAGHSAPRVAHASPGACKVSTPDRAIVPDPVGREVFHDPVLDD